MTKLSPNNYIVYNSKSSKKLDFHNVTVLKDCTDLLNRAQARIDQISTNKDNSKFK